MARNNLVGAWGEALAAEYLRKKHYNVVAHQFHSRFGEIDLVVENRQYIVFVEVKVRKSADFAAAREYVGRQKQDRLRVTASVYLDRFPTKRQPRFDIIEIYAPQGTQTQNPMIEHMEDAFQ